MESDRFRRLARLIEDGRLSPAERERWARELRELADALEHVTRESLEAALRTPESPR